MTDDQRAARFAVIRKQGDGLTVRSDPVKAHAAQVDAGALDLTSLVHSLARRVCQGLGVACGLQANLPDGLCPFGWTQCPHAPEGGSGKPYADGSPTISDEIADETKWKAPGSAERPEKKPVAPPPKK